MSNKKAAIIVSMLIVVWCGWDMKSDYLWADEQIEDMKKDGWRVAQIRRNASDITRFWTLIKKPVTTVIFFDPEIKKENNRFVLVHIRWFSHEDFFSTVEQNIMMLSECRDRRMAVLPSDPSRIEIDGINLLPDDGYNQELAKFFCQFAGIE